MIGLSFLAVAGFSGLAGMCIGFALGIRGSARVTGRLSRGWLRIRRLLGHEGPVTLTQTDRDALASEFAVHTTAVREQVAQFADELAGDDPVLRARLRRFEPPESDAKSRPVSPWDGWSA